MILLLMGAFGAENDFRGCQCRDGTTRSGRRIIYGYPSFFTRLFVPERRRGGCSITNLSPGWICPQGCESGHGGPSESGERELATTTLSGGIVWRFVRQPKRSVGRSRRMRRSSRKSGVEPAYTRLQARGSGRQTRLSRYTDVQGTSTWYGMQVPSGGAVVVSQSPTELVLGLKHTTPHLESNRMRGWLRAQGFTYNRVRAYWERETTVVRLDTTVEARTTEVTLTAPYRRDATTGDRIHHE